MSKFESQVVSLRNLLTFSCTILIYCYLKGATKVAVEVSALAGK